MPSGSQTVEVSVVSDEKSEECPSAGHGTFTCDGRYGSHDDPPERSKVLLNADTRQQHIDHIAGALRIEFPVGIDSRSLREEVESTYDELSRTSTVEAFIPILALRRSRERIDLIVADRTAVAGFVQAGTEPKYQTGDVAHLVDGRFQITHVEPTHDTVRYAGRWLDRVDTPG
jgi:hypothetical protein